MKKPLRILLVILLAIVLLFLGYFAYVMLSYSRLEDNLPLDVQGEADKTAAAGVPYNILSYNIGFGAYEPDYGFFMDGGKESWAFSEKRLISNMENIAEFINSQNADICILQEVDQNATRTYHFDEREFLTEKLAGYSSVWAENWNSPFLFYPSLIPTGQHPCRHHDLLNARHLFRIAHKPPYRDGPYEAGGSGPLLLRIQNTRK